MKKTLNLLFAGLLALTTSTVYGQTSQQMTNAQQQSMTMTTTGIQPPPPPNYSQCTGRTDEASCRQQVDAQYQSNLTYYNQVRQQELAAQQQQQLASQRLYNGAQQAAADSRDQNQQASGAYGTSQMLTQVASMVAMGVYASSGGTNTAALALSIAMAIFSQQAGQQKQSHNTAAYQACSLSNQVTNAQQNCGAAPGPFNYAGYPNNSTIPPENLINPNGQCIASPEICNQITAGLPPGTSLRDFRRGLAEFASGKGVLRANPDGTFTNTKSGRTYSANDFKDAASMAAAGMSPADIALASNMKNGLGNIASAFDPNKDLKAMNGGGEFEDAASQAAGAAAAAAAGDQALNNAGFGNRNIAAAEGLAKDFNGELIGVAGDDIWKMMNRRYKLKTAQDSFMNTTKP